MDGDEPRARSAFGNARRAADQGRAFGTAGEAYDDAFQRAHRLLRRLVVLDEAERIRALLLAARWEPHPSTKPHPRPQLRVTP